MKPLLTILFVMFLLTNEMFAQKLSEPMAAFMEYCVNVRNAAAKSDADELADCISKWRPAQYNDNGEVTKKELFIYKHVLIDYAALQYKSIDSNGETDFGKHLKFMPESIDDLLTNDLEAMNLNAAHQLRSKANFEFLQHDATQLFSDIVGSTDNSNKLQYIVKTLKPKSKTKFSFAAKGHIEMFVVSENNGAINLSAQSNDNTFEDFLPWGKDSAQLVFDSNGGEIVVTVDNLSSNPVSFIFVTSQK